MDGVNTCAAPLDIDPRQRYFTTVQPFSYRDTLTVLGYVQEVAEHLDQLREQLDNLAKDVDAVIDANNQYIKDMADNLLKQMSVLREELIRLIEQSQTTGLAWSPAYGKQDALHMITPAITLCSGGTTTAWRLRRPCTTRWVYPHANMIYAQPP